MTFFNWSKTAASNASADATVNWAEGMSAGAVNDSARAMMAATAKYRDDVSGSITTGGTSTAYTVTSNQTFSSLALLSGKQIAFIPHATNGATVTLNVDSLGEKALRSAPSTELPSGVLLQGTPYIATYYNATNEFILQGFYSSPYAIPIGGAIPYLGSTAPHSSFALPYGQAISRTTYATLWALIGTTHGSGDGSTTFNLPDIRGRVIAGYDSMGGSSANRLTGLSGGVNGDTIGATGGAESVTLDATMMPTHTHTGTTDNESAHTHPYRDRYYSENTAVTYSEIQPNGGNYNSKIGSGNTDNDNTRFMYYDTTTSSGSAHNHTFTSANTGGGLAHNNLQPTIILPFIVRVI